MNYVKHHLANELKRLRGEKSLYQLAIECGISRPVLHRYEKGRLPTDDQLAILAKHFKVSFDSLKFLVFEDLFPEGSPDRVLLTKWLQSKEGTNG